MKHRLLIYACFFSFVLTLDAPPTGGGLVLQHWDAVGVGFLKAAFGITTELDNIQTVVGHHCGIRTRI